MTHVPVAGCIAVVFAAVGALAAGPAEVVAQELERYAFSDDDVAVYNLAGEVRVEAGSGPGVVVEMVRGGADAHELRVETGQIDGSQTLRVIYPADHVVYRAMGRGSRTSVRVRDDGTFFDERGDGWFGSGERITIAGSGRGLEAYADLRIRVPEGTRIAVYLGAGRATVSNVTGRILVETGSGSVRLGLASEIRDLEVDTGSGSVMLMVPPSLDAELELETGSGGIDVDLPLQVLRSERNYLLARVGEGAGTIRVDTGSGGIRVRGS